MSILEDFFSLDDYINITFNILKKTNKSGTFFFDVVLYDESSDSPESEDSLKLYTRWKYMDWDSKNNILELSKIYDPINNEVTYDPILYKDNLVKCCLVEWKFSDTDKEYVPVAQDRIDRLPAAVVDKLLYFYEKAIEQEEDCLGKV